MTGSPQNEYVRFYDDRVKAHSRRLYDPDTLRDRLAQPSAVLTVAVLVLVLILGLPGQFPILERLLSLAVEALWDGFVYVFPPSLLSALDKQQDSVTQDSAPMTILPQNAHAAKSEAIRRVLGLHRPGGMMAGVLRARSRALSATGNALGFKADNDRPPGLGNMDYSCYQNSILQSLASLQTLPEYLSNCTKIAEDAGEDEALAQTLRTLMADLTDGTNNGRTLWTPYLLKSMSSIQQQDASEYFSKVLEDIDKAVAKAVKVANPPFLPESGRAGTVSTVSLRDSQDHGEPASDSGSSMSAEAKKLRNPLEGLTAQRVACTSCGYTEGFFLTTFNCLMLSLDEGNRYHLYERLDSFANIELLDGVHCPKCTLLKAQRLLTRLVGAMEEKQSSPEQLEEPRRRLQAVELALEEEDFEDRTLADKCKITPQSKVNTTKTKQVVIARPPRSLAVHVNRSVFNRMTFDLYKNSAPVSFPSTLDLGPWCLGSSAAGEMPTGNTLETERDTDQENWLAGPTKSLIAGSQKPSRMAGPIYELRAVVTHAGRHENGHYICYRKHIGGTRKPPVQTEGDVNKAAPYPDPAGEDDVEEPASSTTAAEPNCSEMSLDDDEEDDWWRLSDHNVSRVREDEVLGLASGVFMLFYDCVDPEMVLEVEPDMERGEAKEKRMDEDNDEYLQSGSGTDPDGAGSSGCASASDSFTDTDIPLTPSRSSEGSEATVSPGTTASAGQSSGPSDVKTANVS